MKLRECLDKAILTLKESAESTAELKNGLAIMPHVCVFAKSDSSRPEIAGDLLGFDDEKIIIGQSEAVIHYIPRPMSIIKIELVWLEWPRSGYYGETLEEYGGAPQRLPIERSRLIISRELMGEWKIK